MMKSAFRCFQMFLLLCGVFGADEDEVKSVMEGDSVTLNADLTQIKRFYLIEWRFGDPVIAQTDGSDISYPSHSEIFRDRLQLDQTGSLTIKNMKTRHSGLYKLQISHSAGTAVRKFNVTVYESASDAGKSEMKSFSLKEGERVTLQTDVTQLYGDELIVWRFGDEGKLIAKADMEVKSSPLYDSDERFRGRLELDHQTGSLIITNTRTTDSGLYAVKISSKKQTSYQKYVVIISEAGLSSGAVAGIVVVLLLFLAAAAAAGVIYYRRKISELQKQTLSVSVKEGEDVTLEPNKEINKDDVVQWLYGDGEQLTHIAEITTKPRRIVIYDNAADGIFRGRLKLDETTGSLTIKNSRTAHSGPYTLDIISSSGASVQIFFVTVNKRVEVKSVEEDSSVTLEPDTEIQRDELILWTFGHQDDLIAQVKRGTVEICDDGAGEIFRDRLKLNETTGSLTISNITPAHAGLYKLRTISSSRGILCKKFRVSIPLRPVLMTVGESVRLSTDRPKIERDDEIQWMFGDKNILIAEIRGESRETYDGPDGIFRDRLELNNQTGSLTILNSTAEHAGLYKLKIRSSKGDTKKTYSVTTDKARVKSLMKGKNVNESAVEMPLLDK